MSLARVVHPDVKMPIHERADQIWRVRLSDLGRMDYRTRQEFYEAHLAAAIRQDRLERKENT